MKIFRYVGELFNVFFKWWWPVITGIASIASWMTVPNEGLQLSKLAVMLCIVGISILLFLFLSVLARSYQWFAMVESHPKVTGLVPSPEGTSHPCMFLIADNGKPLANDKLLSVFREVNGQEVLIAVLSLESYRNDGTSAQCIPKWISPGHLRELMGRRVEYSSLIVRREIPERIYREHEVQLNNLKEELRILQQSIKKDSEPSSISAPQEK